MRDGLRTIYQEQRTGLVGKLPDLSHGVDRAQHIGDVRAADQPRPLGERCLELIQIEPAILSHAHESECDPRTIADHLPGHQVRVVFHQGEHDLVARRESHAVVPAVQERMGDQVDALCAVAGEHDLTPLVGADETGYVPVCLLVQVRGLLA